jgi:hypothetical protein
VHEVHYHNDGSVKTWTEDAVTPFGHDVSDLAWQVRAMAEAFEKPVLEYETGTVHLAAE